LTSGQRITTDEELTYIIRQRQRRDIRRKAKEPVNQESRVLQLYVHRAILLF